VTSFGLDGTAIAAAFATLQMAQLNRCVVIIVIVIIVSRTALGPPPSLLSNGFQWLFPWG
jgi:hypothetical protein